MMRSIKTLIILLVLQICGANKIFAQSLIDCWVAGNVPSSFTKFKYGDFLEDSSCSTVPAIHVVIIDTNTCEPWGTFYNGHNANHRFGNYNDSTGGCHSRSEYYFVFRQDNQAELIALNNLLKSPIPTGFYMVVYSWLYFDAYAWATLYPYLYNTILDLGAQYIYIYHSTKCKIPWAAFFSIGFPEMTEELLGNSMFADSLPKTDTLHLQSVLMRGCRLSGISQIEEKQLFSIAPNPSNGVFTLKTDNQRATVSIINILGETIYETKITGNEMQIDLSNYAKGLYNVRLLSQQGMEVKRVLTQ